MAGENETVEAAIAAVRKMIHNCPAIKVGGEFEYQLKANGAIDRIESAWRREKAELVECLKEAVHNECYECRYKDVDGGCIGCCYKKWNDALGCANATVAEGGES